MKETTAIRATYFLYLGAIGLIVTYWPLYFQAIGMSPSEIGLVFSGRSVISVLMQPALGYLAVKYGRPTGILRVTLWLGALLSLLMHLSTGLVAVCLLMWLQAFPEAGTVPMLDTTIVGRYGSVRFGSFRLWGSLGYGIAVALFGWAVSGMEAAAAGDIAVDYTPVLYVLAAIFVFRLRETPLAAAASSVGGKLPRSADWWLLLASGWLHWVAVMSYNLFLAIYCIDRGFSSAVPGYAVGLAIVGEVAALALAPSLFARREARSVVAWSLLLSIFRWVATAMALSAWWLILIQVLHFAGFGLWYAGLLRELDHYAEQTPRPLLQSVFASVVLGCGGLAAGLLGGHLVGDLGSAWAFWLAALADGCALGVWLMRGRYFARPPVTAATA